MTRRARLIIWSALAGGIAAGCSLSPQPLPPDQAQTGVPGGAGNLDGGGADGSFLNSTTPDASTDSAPGFGGDAGGPIIPPQGDAGAADAAAEDAGSEEGGVGDAGVEDGGDAGDASPE